MVSATNDPMESFFNSIQVVKDAFSPLEFGIRKAARDLETCCWGGSKNDNRANRVELVTDNSKVQICAAKKKSTGHGNDSNGHCMVNEEKKKGLFIKLPIRSLLGMFSFNLETGGKNNGNSKVVASKKGLKEREMGNEDGSCVNCLQFAVTWSLLVNGFVQAFPSPFKTSKKRLQKVGDDDNNKRYLHLCKEGSKSKVSGELKRKESKGQYVEAFQNGDGNDKERKHVSLECFIGFIFEQLVHNLQKFDQTFQESDGRSCDSDCSTPSPPSSQFDHLRAVMSIWEGRKVHVNGFLGNLSFARVGGVPSSVVGVSSSVNEEGDDGVTTSSSEETGGSSPQKLASGILSIPLSNVERLRSTLSTVSLTELIELLPQLGRSSKDYPDKKKLFSVQDFFRYTESEGMVSRLVRL